MGSPHLIPRRGCALCLRNEKLCKSHIVSRFLMRGAYSEAGTALVKSALPGEPTFNNQGLGHWERLLCLACEQLFEKWETYARDVLVNWTRETYPSLPGINRIGGIDYAKFKLFQMSLLWRLSVCRLPFYARVNLGPLEEELRQMLLAGQPGEASQFGCMMIAVTMQDGSPAYALVEPVSASMYGYRKVNFVAGGYSWTYSVSRRPHRIGVNFHVKKSGELLIPVMDLMDLPSVSQLTLRIIEKDMMEKVMKKPRMPSVLR